MNKSFIRTDLLPRFAGRIALAAVMTLVFSASVNAGQAVTHTRAVVEAVKTLALSTDMGVNVVATAPISSVFIANPEIADVQVLSPTSLMVFGKKTGQTTLIASDNTGAMIVKRNIVVRQDLSNLRLALRAIVPNSKISAESVPNGIVLTGEVKDASQAEDARRIALRYVPKEGEVINRLKVNGGNQIHIRVRFAEVSREVNKRLGVDWENSFALGNFALGLASGVDVVSGSQWVRPTVDGELINALAVGYQGRRASVNGMVDALAKDGLVTILAEPNLTAMSGETASFLAGGEFPVPVPSGQDQITIDWRQYGVSLSFTPTLIGENRINLHVRPEVSQLTNTGAITLNNIMVPALATRRAETTIELTSGQSFAIGGLLNNNQTQSVEKYPLLGDVPILGPLFRSTRFQNDQSELVIIITPYIVKSSVQEDLTLPMDGFAPPTDQERLAQMRISNADPAARKMSGESRAVIVEEEVPIKALSSDLTVYKPEKPASLVHEIQKSKVAPKVVPTPEAAHVSEPEVMETAPPKPLPSATPSPVAPKVSAVEPLFEAKPKASPVVSETKIIIEKDVPVLAAASVPSPVETALEPAVALPSVSRVHKLAASAAPAVPHGPGGFIVE